MDSIIQDRTVEVDWKQLKRLHNAYVIWNKALRETSWASRGANLSEAISEAVVCLCTKGTLIVNGHGDIKLPDGRIAECKATTLQTNDLTSFSPASNFDNLYFVRYASSEENLYRVYDLRMTRNDLNPIKVNSRSTFRDHANQGRRPRFSVIKMIIEHKSLKPTWLVDVSKEDIERLR